MNVWNHGLEVSVCLQVQHRLHWHTVFILSRDRLQHAVSKLYLPGHLSITSGDSPDQNLIPEKKPCTIPPLAYFSVHVCSNPLLYTPPPPPPLQTTKALQPKNIIHAVTYNCPGLGHCWFGAKLCLKCPSINVTDTRVSLESKHHNKKGKTCRLFDFTKSAVT